LIKLAAALSWRLLIAVVLAIAGLRLANSHTLSAVLLGAVSLALAFDAVVLARQPVRTDLAPPMLLPEEARKLHRMEALLDVVTVALFVLAPDGRITYANRAARRIAGAEVRLADVTGIGRTAANTLEALGPGERRIVTLHDERMILAWAGAFSEPGEPEQRLLSLQLVVGGLDAVQLNAWHSMTRVLAHEMMNSLTPITSLSQSLCTIAREKPLGSEIVSALDTIARRSENLMRFVERYRAVAEVPKPQVRTIETLPFLERVVLLVRDRVLRSPIQVETSFLHAPDIFDADPELIEQALLNLLLNAIEALDDLAHGQVTLRAKTDGKNVAFEVCDNGPGTPIGLLEDIFVPFFTTKREGSGVGLSLARQIAIAHGGTLTAHHGLDCGMIFRLIVPTGFSR
jgi:signal transduction histidine kinase